MVVVVVVVTIGADVSSLRSGKLCGIVQPGSVMLCRLRRSQRLAMEKKRQKAWRRNVAKNVLLEIREHRMQTKARVAAKRNEARVALLSLSG